MSNGERTFSMELDIDAEPQAVWQALTEADELMRWFPPVAEVDPGVGGRIRLSWGKDLTGECRIRVWEPASRLEMSWWETPGEQEVARSLAVDFVIEPAGSGRSILRLIHSGFGSDGAWDNEYDSISRGWNFELRSLKHYLENFRGNARRIAFERLPIDSDPRRAWSSLVGPDGLFLIADSATVGDKLELRLPTGEHAVATLLHELTDKDFAAVLDVLDGGLLRLGLETFSGRMELWFWLSSWTLGEDRLQEMLKSWKKAVEEAVSR